MGPSQRSQETNGTLPEANKTVRFVEDIQTTDIQTLQAPPKVWEPPTGAMKMI